MSVHSEEEASTSIFSTFVETISGARQAATEEFGRFWEYFSNERKIIKPRRLRPEESFSLPESSTFGRVAVDVGTHGVACDAEVQADFTSVKDSRKRKAPNKEPEQTQLKKLNTGVSDKHDKLEPLQRNTSNTTYSASSSNYSELEPLPRRKSNYSFTIPSSSQNTVEHPPQKEPNTTKTAPLSSKYSETIPPPPPPHKKLSTTTTASPPPNVQLEFSPRRTTTTTRNYRQLESHSYRKPDTARTTRSPSFSTYNQLESSPQRTTTQSTSFSNYHEIESSPYKQLTTHSSSTSKYSQLESSPHRSTTQSSSFSNNREPEPSPYRNLDITKTTQSPFTSKYGQLESSPHRTTTQSTPFKPEPSPYINLDSTKTNYSPFKSKYSQLDSSPPRTTSAASNYRELDLSPIKKPNNSTARPSNELPKSPFRADITTGAKSVRRLTLELEKKPIFRFDPQARQTRFDKDIEFDQRMNKLRENVKQAEAKLKMLTGGSVPSSPEPSYAPMPEEDAFWNEAPSAPPIKQRPSEIKPNIPAYFDEKRSSSRNQKVVHKAHMREVLQLIPNIQLRRTDTIIGPDGVRKPNPIWIEIYGRK